MAIWIENTVLGDRLKGPEAESSRAARVQLEGKRGNRWMSIGTSGYGAATTDTAASAAVAAGAGHGHGIHVSVYVRVAVRGRASLDDSSRRQHQMAGRGLV